MSFDIATPNNWRRASVAKYCQVQLGKMLQSEPSGIDDELLPYLRAINISKGGVDFSHNLSMWIKPHEKDKFRLEHDDILVSEGGDAGRTAHFLADGEFYFQNAINRIRPIEKDQIGNRYLYYWFTFLKLSGYVELICNVATIPHFTAEKVKAAPIAFPSVGTQKRIAAYLDEGTAQIDALIEKKQALLERLAEKRQAIITQAVTKGLNPAAPMKDSGIDWLGQIPTHWEVWPLKRMVESATYGISESLTSEGAVAILRMGNLQDGELQLDDLRYVESVDSFLLLKVGDVVFNRTNSLDLVGKAALVRSDHGEPLSLASYLVRFRFNQRFDPAYAVHAMGSESLLRLARTYALPSIGQANLNPGRYSAIPFPLPPLEEQISIRTHVDEQIAATRAVEAKIRTSIEALNEYRSALITAAVTGQIEGLR